jgi:hypothetical protein
MRPNPSLLGVPIVTGSPTRSQEVSTRSPASGSPRCRPQCYGVRWQFKAVVLRQEGLARGKELEDTAHKDPTSRRGGGWGRLVYELPTLNTC